MRQSGIQPENLVGRLEELEFLERFLQRAAAGGGALLLSGEAGVGKSALLEATAQSARAAGVSVLQATGNEFEAEIPFAALGQALAPLLDDLSSLSDDHAKALHVALGTQSGPAPGRLLVSNAVTLLLRSAAASAPLLLVVDDLPWLDRASAGVLSFAARRLTDSRAGLIAAARTGSAGYFDVTGLTELNVPLLDERASSQLLADRFPDLDQRHRNRVLSTAQGNPLALLELPPALHGVAGPGSRKQLPEILPLGERLQQMFADRMASLAPPTRTLLLTAALEGKGDLQVLARTEAGVHGLDALAAAERDRLVSIDSAGRRIVFRHPLVRSAAVATASLSEQRRAHRSLAAALSDPERRAWHLGEAAEGPAEDVAGLLEAAAHRVLARGDYQTVITLLCRAADLSPEPAARGRRLAEAAYLGAEGMAETVNSADLLAQAREASRDADVSLAYASAASLVLLDTDGDVDTAHRLLVKALDSHPHRTDPADSEVDVALWTLALICVVGGRAEIWETLHTAVRRLTGPPLGIFSLSIGMYSDPARNAAALMPELERALAGVHQEADPNMVQNIAAAAMYVDRLAEVREPLWRTIRQGRDGGPGRRRIVALMDVCVDDFHRGAWREQEELAAEGLAVCEEVGGTFFGFYFRYHQALLAAVQGRSEASRALAEQMLNWAEPRGVGMAQAYARHVITLDALARNDFETAYDNASAISPAGVLASHVPHALWVAMDLVEAAVGTGRRAEAHAHVQAMREAGLASLSPRLAILVTAAAALTAEDSATGTALFERALSLPTAGDWPFDTARVRLLHGERLRRARATAEARKQLKAALEAFEELGAVPWAARAGRELRAAGQATRPPSPSEPTAVDLTPQEGEIARLAASGLTNKEIAARLYISPRTVSGRLYRIFPKLGITTRAALRDALGPE